MIYQNIDWHETKDRLPEEGVWCLAIWLDKYPFMAIVKREGVVWIDEDSGVETRNPAVWAKRDVILDEMVGFLENNNAVG